MFNNIFWNNRAGSWNGAYVSGIGSAEAPAGDQLRLWDMGSADGTGLLEPTNSVLQTTTGTVASPTNKRTAEGRQAYLNKRREGRSAGASLVEIDLVLQGQPLLEYSREGLPDWNYAVTVTRATQPDRFEVYTATLQKRLPRFRLPLAGDDRDTVVDLQTAFLRCFEQGDFASKIEYAIWPGCWAISRPQIA